MNVIQWISLAFVLFSYGDAGDILPNGTLLEPAVASTSGYETLYVSGSPCSADKQFASSGPQQHYNGFCYWHSNFTNISWYRAVRNCRSMGSDLVSIHSMEELNFLQHLVQNYTDYFWIGLMRKGLYSSVTWSDGTPVDFVNWEDGYVGNERFRTLTCISLNPSNGYFMKTSCFGNLAYICKAVDELEAPSTTVSTPSHTTTVLPVICPDEWDRFGDKCYGAFGFGGSLKETWNVANQECLNIGATLVSIHSRDEQEFLFRMMRELTVMSWIGFHEVPSSTDRAFHWSDDSPVDFTNWDTNQPNNWNNLKEECTNMRLDSPHFGKWNDAHCELKQSYICQIHIDPKNAKFGLDVDTCRSPKGWIKLTDSCYKIFSGTGNNMTWLEAQYFCRDFGGNLVTVKSYKDSTFLRFHLSDLQGEFWIGLRNEMRKDSFAWITGRTKFSNWDKGQPYEFSDQPNCVASKPDGRWVIRSCDENHPFICEVDEETPTPAPQEPMEELVCPNNSLKWRDYDTRFCYIIEMQNLVQWYKAAHICFQEGGFLASFHSIEEVNVIINQTKDYKDPLYIGLAQAQHGDYIWDDRTVVDFANWHSGQPSSESQMCVEMLPASGKWNDADCEIRRGYICSIPKVFHNASIVDTTEKISDTGDESTIGMGGILGIVLFFVVAVIISVGAYRCLYPPRKSFRSLSESELCHDDL